MDDERMRGKGITSLQYESFDAIVTASSRMPLTHPKVGPVVHTLENERRE